MSRASPPARVPSLDGLRGTCICVVLMGHLMGTRHFLPAWPWLLNLVELGVRTFFVISGYLISTLLFKDRERIMRATLTVRQGLLRFYVRRVFRIFPGVAVLILVTQ